MDYNQPPHQQLHHQGYSHQPTQSGYSTAPPQHHHYQAPPQQQYPSQSPPQYGQPSHPPPQRPPQQHPNYAPPPHHHTHHPPPQQSYPSYPPPEQNYNAVAPVVRQPAKRKGTPELGGQAAGAPPAKKQKTDSDSLVAQLAALQAQMRHIDKKITTAAPAPQHLPPQPSGYPGPTSPGPTNLNRSGYSQPPPQPAAQSPSHYGQQSYPPQQPPQQSYQPEQPLYSYNQPSSQSYDNQGYANGSMDIGETTSTPPPTYAPPSAQVHRPPQSQQSYQQYPAYNDPYASPRLNSSAGAPRGRGVGRGRGAGRGAANNPPIPVGAGGGRAANSTFLPHQLPGPKRPPPPGTPESLKFCMALIDELMSHHMAWPFNEPVDPIKLGIPDYFTVIKHPMDLGTVRRNLEDGYYPSVQSYIEHVRLVWANALTFNEAGSDVAIMAETLSLYFEHRIHRALELENHHTKTPSNAEQKQELAATLKGLQDAMQLVTAQLQEARQQGMAAQQAAQAALPSASVPKPRPLPTKINPRNYPAMTFDEKMWLSETIDTLNPQYLSGVTSIIADHMPDSLRTAADVIEIDIDAMNSICLRRLEQYVKTIVKREAASGVFPSTTAVAPIRKAAPPKAAVAPPSKRKTSTAASGSSASSSSTKKKAPSRTANPLSPTNSSRPNKKKALADSDYLSSSSEPIAVADSPVATHLTPQPVIQPARVSEESSSDSDSSSSDDSESEEGGQLNPAGAHSATVDTPAQHEDTMEVVDVEGDGDAAGSNVGEGKELAGSASMVTERGVESAIVTEASAPTKPRDVVIKNVASWNTAADDDPAMTETRGSPATGGGDSDRDGLGSPPPGEQGAEKSTLWSQVKSTQLQRQQKAADRQEQEEKLLKEKEDRDREIKAEEERKRREQEDEERKKAEEAQEKQRQAQAAELQQRREAERQALMAKSQQQGLDLMNQSRVMNSFEHSLSRPPSSAPANGPADPSAH